MRDERRPQPLTLRQEQIIGMLKEHKAGMATAYDSRKHGVSAAADSAEG